MRYDLVGWMLISVGCGGSGGPTTTGTKADTDTDTDTDTDADTDTDTDTDTDADTTDTGGSTDTTGGTDTTDTGGTDTTDTGGTDTTDTGGTGTDTTDTGRTDTTDTGGTDTGSTDTGTDTGGANLAELTRTGEAVVGVSYLGTESVRLTTEGGAGDVVCEIAYSLESVNVRTDCASCDWAFDLELGDATVIADPIGACLVGLGVDASTVASWNGQIVSYGFDSDYFGHAEVLMGYDGVTWQALVYGAFDPATGAFAYTWFESYGVPY